MSGHWLFVDSWPAGGWGNEEQIVCPYITEHRNSLLALLGGRLKDA